MVVHVVAGSASVDSSIVVVVVYYSRAANGLHNHQSRAQLQQTQECHDNLHFPWTDASR